MPRFTKRLKLLVGVPIIATLALLAQGGVVAGDVRPIPNANITPKTVIIVPNHDFYDVTIITPNGPSQKGLQRAPFGNLPLQIPITHVCPEHRTVRSNWPLNSTIVLTTSFDLPAGAKNLRVLLSVDNDVQVSLNGTNFTSLLIPGFTMIHDGCPMVDEFKFDAPNSPISPVPGPILKVGTNTLEIRGIDRGVESYLDLRVLVDMP